MKARPLPPDFNVIMNLLRGTYLSYRQNCFFPNATHSQLTSIRALPALQAGRSGSCHKRRNHLPTQHFSCPPLFCAQRLAPDGQGAISLRSVHPGEWTGRSSLPVPSLPGPQYPILSHLHGRYRHRQQPVNNGAGLPIEIPVPALIERPPTFLGQASCWMI